MSGIEMVLVSMVIILGVLVLLSERRRDKNQKVFGLEQALAAVRDPELAGVAGMARRLATKILGYEDVLDAEAQAHKQGLNQAVADSHDAVRRIQNEELPGAEKVHAEKLRLHGALLVARLDRIKVLADRRVARLEARIEGARKRHESRSKSVMAKADAKKTVLEAELTRVRDDYKAQVAALEAAIAANQAELAELAQVMQAFAVQAS